MNHSAEVTRIQALTPNQVADELNRQEKRIAELEAERDKYHDALNTAMTSFGELQAELEKKQQSTAMFKLGGKAGMERAAELEKHLEERLATIVRLYVVIKRLRERIAELEAERDNWEETAKRHYRNEEYYRGLLIKCGETIGAESYISDDGSIQEDVLCAKIPELVAGLFNKGLERAAEIAKTLQDLKGSFAYRSIREEIKK